MSVIWNCHSLWRGGLCSGGSRSAAGYARSKPIAIEVYSDKITYYKEGTKDSRVLAVVYEDDADHQTTNANKPEDKVNVAQVYVENTPIRLEVEKVKESYVGKANTTADKTVSYKISGRVDGKYSEIGKIRTWFMRIGMENIWDMHGRKEPWSI